MEINPPLVTVEELEYRLGEPLGESGLPRAEAALDDVSALVRTTAGRAFAECPPVVRTVVLRAAERVFRNPHGVIAETAGDYSYRRADAAIGVAAHRRRGARHSPRRIPLWTTRTARAAAQAMSGESRHPGGNGGEVEHAHREDRLHPLPANRGSSFRVAGIVRSEGMLSFPEECRTVHLHCGMSQGGGIAHLTSNVECRQWQAQSAACPYSTTARTP
jgi:hypothetical protein